MKMMGSAVPFKACPPDGTYPFNITEATPGFTKVRNEGQQNQKGGDSQIALALEIADGEHAGYQAYDNLGTDGGTTYGSASKKRLRQLDVPGLDSDQEIPDDVIAQSLLNRRVFAVVKREQREDAKGEKQFDIDEKTGLKVPLYRLKIIGYQRQATGAQTGAPMTGPMQTLPMAPGLPQGMPTAPGYPQQPQYAQPGQQQFAPPPAPGAWPAAPGGYAPPAPGAVPGAYAPQAPQGGAFPQVAAPQGWVSNGAGAPVAPGQPGLPFPGAPGAPGTRPA